jgi:hypothetical protein
MELDLTKESDVVTLMSSSKSEKEWNANCNKVETANNGYPSYWYQAIVLSGVMSITSYEWNIPQN